MKYHYRQRLTQTGGSLTKLKLFSLAAAALVVTSYSLAGSHIMAHISARPWRHDNSSESAKKESWRGHTARKIQKLYQKTDNTNTPNANTASATGTSTSTPVTNTGGATGTGTATVIGANGTSAGTIISTVYTTAYTYFDNTPAGSADIAFPHSEYPATIHEKAGGNGTYADPLTLAVGHVISGGKDTPDFAPGTRFYFPDVRKYAIVEDTCGDGSSPQNIACHNVSKAGVSGVTLWLDLWIGGSAGDNKNSVQNCANTVTDSTGALHTVVKDPSPNYAVSVGAVYQNGSCIQPGNKGFGNALVTQ